MSGQNPYGYGQQQGYGYGGQQMSYDQQMAYQQQMMYRQQMGYQQQQWGGYGGQQQQQQQQYPGGFNPYGQQQQQQQPGFGQQNSAAAALAAQDIGSMGKGGGRSSSKGNSSAGGKDGGGKGGKSSSKGGWDDNQSMRSSNQGQKGGGQKKPAAQELTLEEYQAQKKAEKAAREEKIKKQQAEARERIKREQEAGPPAGVEFLRPEIQEAPAPKEEPKPAPEPAPAPKEEPKPDPTEEEAGDDWEEEAEEPVEEPVKEAEEPPAPVVEKKPEPVEPPKQEAAVIDTPAPAEPVEEEEEEEEVEAEAEGGEGKKKVEKGADLKEPDPRPHLNVVFIGHVDAGKSTTCGNILFLSGCVDDRTVEKYQKEAKDKNRESWFLAYIMDTNDEEKAKGKTVEVGRAHFETSNRRFTILDAPGHKSYVPNMIAGASQADIAVLIISARKGEFETGFDRGGQTREHALLAKTLGVEKLLITINKMDDHSVEWAQARFDEIKGKMAPFLKERGFKEDQVVFLPISGLTGDNIKERLKTPAWYSGQTLLDTLNTTEISRPSKEASLRIPMLDGYRDMGNITAIGKVEQGCVKPGQKCIIMPIGQKCTVQTVNINDEPMKFANVGENVTLKVSGATEDQLTKGFVLCPVVDPIRVVSKFKAQLQVMELPEERPVMTSGYRAVMHVHVATEECEILKLYESMMPKTKKKEKNPRFVRENSIVTVSIQLMRPTALDVFTGTQQLGRFTLRDEGRTIAIGKITELPKAEK